VTIPKLQGRLDDPKLREALIAAGLTILIVGTSFLRYPQGLAAWTQSLATYLMGWSTPSGQNPLTLLAALVIFQPFGLAFAILCIVRKLIKHDSKNENLQDLIWALAFWILAGIALALLYPARQVSDVVWVLVPLWGLAATELDKFLPEGKPNLVSSLQAGLVVILVALLWNTLISTSQLTPAESVSPATIRLVLLMGIILLGALTTILIGLGWNWK